MKTSEKVSAIILSVIAVPVLYMAAVVVSDRNANQQAPAQATAEVAAPTQNAAPAPTPAALTKPPTVEQQIAAAVAAHGSDDWICNPQRNAHKCGTPIVDIGKLAAALLSTAGTQAAWSNSGGLPVKWTNESDIPSRDGILVFGNGTTGDIHIAPTADGLTQIAVSTNDCASTTNSSVCTADIRQALKGAGLAVQRVCYGDAGPQYQVTGPGSVPAVITWRVSTPDMSPRRAASAYMEIFPGMTTYQDATAIHGCKQAQVV
ncbi:UNVERIFIED_ORG: hypothetical protein ABIC62_001863 [Burkholderia sp. 1595]|uniref:Uncharacterized protein n=1 Tax=Paraburkholderia terricola TaxID=169427 RepID=A0ABU1LP10_9BURK|nr:hypothetical protein [Paraburkholderia terricola]MDR6408473.1 hypothetical protein [Paraburkholderia terricola]